MNRFLAYPLVGGFGVVVDSLVPGRKFWFDSYTSAVEWAEISNRTPC